MRNEKCIYMQQQHFLVSATGMILENSVHFAFSHEHTHMPSHVVVVTKRGRNRRKRGSMQGEAVKEALKRIPSATDSDRYVPSFLPRTPSYASSSQQINTPCVVYAVPTHTLRQGWTLSGGGTNIQGCFRMVETVVIMKC